jgi:hypothetical protein
MTFRPINVIRVLRSSLLLKAMQQRIINIVLIFLLGARMVFKNSLVRFNTQVCAEQTTPWS